MHTKSLTSFIETEIQKRIESFDSKRKFYRKRANQLTISVSALSAFTTFFIGVGQAYDAKIVSMIALATSSSMTILNALDSLYSYRQRWVQNNDTVMNLYELRSDMRYEKASRGEESNIENPEKYYQRYQQILRAANAGWKEDRLRNIKTK